MTKQNATITAGSDGRCSITIGAQTRDGFALVWRGDGTLQFRRTAGGPPETVAVSDTAEAGRPLPSTFQAPVLSLTHPDLWTMAADGAEAANGGGDSTGADEPAASLEPDPATEASEPAETTADVTRARRR